MFLSYFKRSNAINGSLLLILFVIAEIIINPIGDFPLNDDWVYGRAAYDLATTNKFSPEIWGRASMLAHLYYVKPIISIFGFSYTVLRFSTLLLSALGIVVFYVMCVNHFKLSKAGALFAALLMLFNPLFFCLSNSFMTDVPFLCTAIFGFYFYFNFRQYNNRWYLLLSLLFFIWCILIRQLGIAFVLGIFFTDTFLSKKLNKSSVLFILLALAPWLLFEFWFKATIHTNSYPSVFESNIQETELRAILEFICNFLKRWIHYVSVTGLVLSPVLLPYMYQAIRAKEIVKNKLLLSIALFLPVAWSFRKFPIGNYLYNCGIGPSTLYDTYLLHINVAQNESAILFFLLFLISVIGAFSLVYCCVLKLSRYLQVFDFNKTNFVSMSVLISMGFYYLLLAFNTAIFDRYIFIVSVFLIPMVFKASGLQKYYFAIVLLTGMMVFSVFATKDHLSSNATKWNAINFLHTYAKAPDVAINGGYEHAGLLDIKNHFNKWKNIPKHPFVISAGNIKDYHTWSWFTYQRFIPLKTDTIFVLRKNEE